jgi:hypothetical protein
VVSIRDCPRPDVGVGVTSLNLLPKSINGPVPQSNEVRVEEAGGTPSAMRRRCIPLRQVHLMALGLERSREHEVKACSASVKSGAAT